MGCDKEVLTEEKTAGLMMAGLETVAVEMAENVWENEEENALLTDLEGIEMVVKLMEANNLEKKSMETEVRDIMVGMPWRNSLAGRLS